MNRANYTISPDSTPECLVLVDNGPWDQFSTITNDAENIVRDLVRNGSLTPGRRLEYYDSDGQRDQIIVADGQFRGFAFGSRTP